METTIFDRFRKSLVEARSNLTRWIATAPEQQREARIAGADERAILERVKVIDSAIEKADAHTLGLCEVCHGYVDTDHLEMDYTASVCIDHFSEQERRQLEYELELAQSVQRTLLPQHAPDIPGIEVGAFIRPAQIVGGDYFDFLQFGDGAFGLALADVAGHGMSASLHMASVQTLLRTLAPASDGPTQVVQQIHHLFRHNIRFTTFVTLFLAAFDPKTRALTYCNAGHNPPILLRQQGRQVNAPIWLEPTGPAIGLVEDFEYRTERVTLAPGDICVLYTDGITEAFNGNREMFGKERLAEVIQQKSWLPARDLVGMVRRRVEEFIGDNPLEDDATVLVLKVAEGD